MDQVSMVEVFRALGDDNRLQIIEILTSGECCACELLERLSISQSTLSHHMRILSACGLVNGRKVGKWCHYSLNGQMLSSVIGKIQLWQPTNEGVTNG